jgi:serine/threonine protein kinase
MELLEGRTLAAELRERGPFPLARCAEILGPVCGALAAAHDAGVIHRDVKPENVFLHEDAGGEVVKVLDFGMAKIVGEDTTFAAALSTATGRFAGTPAYVAPEILWGRPYDGRADVYGAGVVLYEMLCGRPPFVADGTVMAILAMAATQAPPPPSSLRPGLPAEVSARELADEFAAACG